MENEGIMALPPGSPMQNQGSVNAPTYVSSADTYDAALTALGLSSNDPTQAQAVRQAVRESIDELDLSPTEMDALLEVLEYMSQNPDQYPQIRQRLIDSGMMDEDDLPEAYDPTFLGIAIMALNEAMMGQAQGAAAPMEMAPRMEGMEEAPQPMGFAEGGLADVAKYLASQGRNGDSILAHITPAEARLLKSMGGSGTINPTTGLPEFFLKKLFKKIKSAVKKVLKNPIFRIIATVALATVLGPAGLAVVGSKAAAGAIASGAITAASGGKLKDVLVASATGYFGGGGTIGGVTPAAAVAGKLGLSGALGTGVGTGVTGAGIGLLAGMKPEEAVRMGAMQGLSAGAAQAFQNMRAAPSGSAYGLEDVKVTAQRINPAASPIAQAAPGAATGSNYGLEPIQVTAQRINPPQTSMLGRVTDYITGKKTFADGTPATFKNTFLVNPNAAPGSLARYAPGVATALAATAATGGFKGEPAQENPLFERGYTGEDYIRDNPELFKGRIEPTVLKPYNPVVETPGYAWRETPAPGAPEGPPQYSAPTIPIGPVPTYTPPSGTVTNMPGGVPQPYNVSGLYGVPLLYGNPVRPVGYAAGGQAVKPGFTDPINIAQTEAFLVAGPRAAQQAGRAVDSLKNQGIMGVPRMRKGGDPSSFPRKTGEISGPGTGTSDSIPAMLSDGEFVFTARAVRNAGNGSRRKGARRMYKLMKMLEGGSVKGK